MPENHFAEAQEHLELLEHRPESRIKIVITVTILVVTMLTTLAGVLAATWSAKASEAQRARLQATAESLQDNLTAAQRQATVDQATDDATEAGWRAAFLSVYQLEISDKTIIAELKTQADAASAAQKKATALVSTDPSAAAELQRPGIVAEQQAKADAQQGEGWLTKNNGALAVVSMLALALFLLGLALTVKNRPTQFGFTALAIVMALIAAGRLVQISASHIDAPSATCIDDFGKGSASALAGDYDQGALMLQGVVHACPGYSQAWVTLAQVQFQQGGAGATARAQDSFTRALATADVKSSDIYNDLGYLQTLDKDFYDAQRNLDTAGAMSPENQVIMMSRAELAAARNQTDVADKYLDDVLEQLVDRGPYYRNEFFFANARQDYQAFRNAGQDTDSIKAFFLKVREAEAGLDTIGRPDPLPTTGKITNIMFRKSSTQLGTQANFVTIGFDHSGLKAGDELSFRFYNQGLYYDLTASLNQKVSADSTLVQDGTEEPDSDFRVGLSQSGTTTLEVYLNGNFEGSASLTVQ